VFEVVLIGMGVREIAAGVVALAIYFVSLDQLHAPTRDHLVKTVALFSPRQMVEYLRERP